MNGSMFGPSVSHGGMFGQQQGGPLGQMMGGVTLGQLPPELLQLLQQLLASGEFNSVSETVRQSDGAKPSVISSEGSAASVAPNAMPYVPADGGSGPGGPSAAAAAKRRRGGR